MNIFMSNYRGHQLLQWLLCLIVHLTDTWLIKKARLQVPWINTCSPSYTVLLQVYNSCLQPHIAFDIHYKQTLRSGG